MPEHTEEDFLIVLRTLRDATEALKHVAMRVPDYFHPPDMRYTYISALVITEKFKEVKCAK